MLTAALWAGGLDLGFAAFHLMFWRLFKWPDNLERSGAINAAITQTLNIVGIYIFTFYGGALVWLALSGPQVPAILAWAGAGFWLLRLTLQPILFPMRNGPSLAITGVFVVATVAHALSALQI
jgi:hypothetical protein